ncbi:MAG: histidine phosphatase family protein [Chloroflexota bacterium]|nr:histidine phosphatase family protein [Chloroflexota bacterium]
MTTIYLIRHGETEWNRFGRWQGHADVPLSAEGYLQAAALAERLVNDGVQFDHMYASDLRRAFETAQIVARALFADGRRQAQAFPAVREINVGSWSGLTRSEIIAQFPGAFTTVHHAPDAETPDVFAERVGGALTDLALRHPGQTLAIVTHGGTIRAMLKHVLAQHDAPTSVPFIGNTSITELRLEGDAWRVLRLNDLAHVEAGKHTAQAPDVLASGNESSAAV